MKIVPVCNTNARYTGDLQNLKKTEIDKILGFKPNGAFDDSKSRWCWDFKANGKECSIYDWKGSSRYGQWSFRGPADIFQQIFGTERVIVRQ